MEQFEAVIIDPELEARTRLRQATLALPAFGKVVQAAGSRDAHERIKDLDRPDIIFLSYRLGEETIKSYVLEAKQASETQDSAFVMVLGEQSQASTTIASSMLIGVDGFLFEPFSVDSLMEITKLATRVKTERAAFRQRGAIKLLVAQIASQIDVVAQLRCNGHEGAISTRSLREMCTVLTTLEAPAKEYYYETLVDQFGNLPVPLERSQTKLYNGASKRLRQRVEQKLNQNAARRAEEIAKTGS